MEAKYFEGKTILITGVTGFLAKVFLEKLLRVQPKIKKVFLIIRAKNEESLVERLNDEVFGMHLFQVLRGNFDDLNDFNFHVLAKIIPILGDTSQENLGIADSELRNEMCQEIDIIIHSAGTIKFDERYDVALGINTFGVLHILNFARKCPKLEGLLHVSTAYVHYPRAGVILETPFRSGETLEGAQVPYLSIDTEKKIVEAKSKELETLNADSKNATRVMIDLGSERAKQHGWPNAYTFTKAMGEMILNEFKEHVRIIIIRPTMISSTYKEPFPGWNEGLRTFDSILVAYAKGEIEFLFGDPRTIADVIPCDMVVNCMMATVAKHFDLNNKQYDHELISKVLDMLTGEHPGSWYADAKRSLDRAMTLVLIYGPFAFSKGIFDDFNTQTLRVEMSDGKEDMSGFDPKSTNWEEYLTNIHFPGLVKYVLLK
ncbi:probable fatty acyl-CoA reductase 4 [Henckelia pumila]|uniref:probable fatty acyl-CoA reductase 4 n=1 Tax=Henckelia pumila TaxID=405737 RepID=UPI003C6DF39A